LFESFKNFADAIGNCIISEIRYSEDALGCSECAGNKYFQFGDESKVGGSKKYCALTKAIMFRSR